MSVLQPVWSDKRETARRVKQRISAICRWAVAQRHRNDDPAGIMPAAAPPHGDVKAQHLPALAYDELAQCLATVRATRGASASSELSLEFLIPTASRSGEVRKATWDEIDVGGAVWTVPAEHTQANREHRCRCRRAPWQYSKRRRSCRKPAGWYNPIDLAKLFRG